MNEFDLAAHRLQLLHLANNVMETGRVTNNTVVELAKEFEEYTRSLPPKIVEPIQVSEASSDTATEDAQASTE